MNATVEKIVKEKERRGLSDQELSLMAGVNYWKVYHTLRGHSERSTVIERLAHVLGVTVSN